VHSVFRIASRAVRILPGSSPFDRPRSRFAEFLSAPGRAQLIEPMKRLHIHVERGSMCSETDLPANCIARGGETKMVTAQPIVRHYWDRRESPGRD
jgi:hypothetical protein